MNVKNRYKLYQKGEDKFTEEFDAIYYAKSIRNLNTLVSSLLDDSEKFMIRFQKCNTITLKSGSDNDSNSDGNEAPKLFSKLGAKALHKIKIDEFMRKYKSEKWSEQDYKLLNGVCHSRGLTNNDIEILKRPRFESLYTANEIEADQMEIYKTISPDLSNEMERNKSTIQYEESKDLILSSLPYSLPQKTKSSKVINIQNSDI
eukprot:CAMPEP_0205800820 /NCGR_PEP_ID=MMETSP0205-20121125/2604_1 /ASSEMBLY_ACC=CAM_ASM_000278 /TAXON_ID=36767 /ORGANISM="Euplotes focardii, Strain TN1" /LENGTH=202 /DNA_ID=CAMNT_0053064541 /DNA_START=1333 /DNA_END=1938 /DNA_ORIENTATION=+